MPTEAQALAALEHANRARLGGAAVRREIRHGELSAAEALDDPRAGPLTLERLLMSQLRWGKQRVHRTLVGLRWAADGEWPTMLWPDLRVRDLTERQKQLLKAYLP